MRTCVRCGCTDLRTCLGGCSWVSLDPPVCSSCEPELEFRDDREVEYDPPVVETITPVGGAL